MAPTVNSIEIARPAEEVFAYVTDPTTMPEWQEGVVSGHMDAPTTRVGSRCTTIRKIGGGEREVNTTITEYVRRAGGPTVASTVPSGRSSRSRSSRSPTDHRRGSRSNSTSRATGSAACWFRSSSVARRSVSCRKA